MKTELAIYEAYVFKDGDLYDQTVARGLETLIKQMRAGTLPPLPEKLTLKIGGEADFVAENIRRRWEDHFETKWMPPKEQQIGVLRSVLGTIETMRTPGPRSQGYLKYIKGFLTKKLGVSVRGEDVTPEPEPQEDELVQLGYRWVADDDQDAKADFFELADSLMSQGQAERVMDACHQLLGEQSDASSRVVSELSELSHRAGQAIAV